MEVNRLNLQQSNQDLALQKLVKETVVPGAFSYAYEREAGYEVFAKTQGQSFEVYGALESGGDVLGATQVTYDQVYWNGSPTRVSYSGDTRVSVKARGRRLADSLIQNACHEATSQGMPLLGAVMGSNHLVLEKKLNDWRKVGVDFKVVGELKALLFRAKSFPSSEEIKVRTATESDFGAMFQLWQKEQLQKNLGRFYADVEAFKKAYETTPGVTLADTIVAESLQSQTILGFLSVWDQSRIRKIRIREFSRAVKIALPFLRLWIPFPAVGEELKIGYGFQACLNSQSPEKEKALNALVRQARTRVAQKGMLFFSLGFDARDELLKTAKKQALTANSVKVIAANSLPDGRLFHLEVGLG
jgi:hypothetical protein